MSSRTKNVVLLAKQDKIGSIYKKYSLVLTRVDKAPEYLRRDDGRSFAQILNSLKFSWKEVHVIPFEVWFLKHFFIYLSMQEKVLIRNVME